MAWLDADVLAWLKADADGYQIRMSAILRHAMLADLKNKLDADHDLMH